MSVIEKGVNMKQKLTRLCLAVLILAQFSQGVTALATTTEPSTVEPTTATSLEPTTSLSELPMSTVEIPLSSEEPTTGSTFSEEPTTTVQEPSAVTTTTIVEEPTTTTVEEARTTTSSVETTTSTSTTTSPSSADDKDENIMITSPDPILAEVGGMIDTIRTPDEELGIKIRLNTLISLPTLSYRVINKKTGKHVWMGVSHSVGVDYSILTDTSNKGKTGYSNIFTDAVSLETMGVDPKGDYKIVIESSYNYPKRDIILEKTINIGKLPTSHPSFPKAGVKIETIVLPNGGLTFTVRLDTMQSAYDSMEYDILHQKTGTVVSEDNLWMRDVDLSVLKDKKEKWPKEHYNVASQTISPLAFRHDPEGTYIIRIRGHISNDKNQMAGIVDASKTIVIKRPSTPTPPILPTVTPLIDTIVLPNGNTIFKVRTDFLARYSNSKVYYEIIHTRTGKVISADQFYRTKVDASVLKNKTHLGNWIYVNDWSGDVHISPFYKSDGDFRIRIYGTVEKVNGDKGTAVMLKGEKTFSLNQARITHPLLSTVGGKVDMKLLPNQNRELTIRLDTLFQSDQDIYYQLIHQKTGKEIALGRLVINDGIDPTTLKNQSLKGTFGKHNIVKMTISSYVFREDPTGTYIVQIFGKTRDFELFNIKKTVNFETVFVHRMYHAGMQSYLYTKNYEEIAALERKGWTHQGVAWKTETKKGTPVYRLYNPKQKIYFFTKNTNEYQSLVKSGWNAEGVAFRSYGNRPVYRLRHQTKKSYFYTSSTKERDLFVKRGWKSEGIAWHSQP